MVRSLADRTFQLRSLAPRRPALRVRADVPAGDAGRWDAGGAPPAVAFRPAGLNIRNPDDV